MFRNDYRRALIMMRSLRTGVAGYVRLERRTLMGTMQFTVTGARENETLYALLLYKVNGLWYAQILDQLGPARYGQSGLVYRFDPRSLAGRTLEDYTLVAVASLSDGVCDLALAGFLNGTQAVDWPQVRQAVCQSFAETNISDRLLVDQGAPVPPICVPDRCSVRPQDNDARTLPPDDSESPVTDGTATLPPDDSESPVTDGTATLPPDDSESPVADGTATLPPDDSESFVQDGTADEMQDGESDAAVVPIFSSEPRAVSEASESAAQAQQPAEAPDGTAPQTADSAETEDSTSPQRAAQAQPSAPQTTESSETVNGAPPDTTPADAFDTPAKDNARPDAFDTPARLNTEGGCENGCAAAELDTDSDQPWPACIEPLRMLYRTRASCRPFDAAGFVLIKAPIAPETGLDHCIAGLSCAGGRPERVLYGIPARYTPEPPPGLEGYIWRGGTSGGYWVIVRPVC